MNGGISTGNVSTSIVQPSCGAEQRNAITARPSDGWIISHPCRNWELDVPDELDQLEADLIRLFQLPPKASTDASHLGMAMLHRMDYLLTWNCRHLANATLQKDLHDYCRYHNLHFPIVCTPETLIQLKP